MPPQPTNFQITYLIALAFTIAGYAIQTFKPTGSVILDTLFILSIALILISGILSVYRMDLVVTLYNAGDEIVEQTIRHNQTISSLEDHEVYEKNTKKINNLQSKITNLYSWCRGIFLLGLIILFISKLLFFYQ